MSRLYVGQRSPAGCRAYALEHGAVHALPVRRPHSVWSFTWGRHGFAATELAWALLQDATGSADVADLHCADFSAAVIARLPLDAFTLSRGDVLGWLADPGVMSRTRVGMVGLQART